MESPTSRCKKSTRSSDSARRAELYPKLSIPQMLLVRDISLFRFLR